MNDNEKHLDLTGLALFWEKVKAKINLKADKTELPTKISQLINDSGFITAKDVPTADADNMSLTFTQATTRAAIASGEKLSTIMGKIAKYMADFGSLAFQSTVAKTDLASDVQTSLGKADTALQSYTETDPTVPAWAKAATKPTYTAAEVGALTPAEAESTYAKKTDITNVYKYKGSKIAVEDLPSDGNTVGDVWNVEGTNMNYGWTGSEWDPLGQIFSVTSITVEEIETIMAS